MNHFLTPDDYKYLYQITAEATPLKTDCGKLCQSICCRPNNENTLGMYLFPGEETMFTGKEDWLDWEEHDPIEHFFPDSWPNPVFFVKCTKQCPRELRPLSCRFFPLTPHLFNNGNWILIHETLELPYKCPLIERKFTLDNHFIETIALAWEILLKDPRIKDLVREDSEERENAFLRTPEILWQNTKKLTLE
ncbi:hypothetical protein [Desulfolucanica intricata]|uniref:hypothetical protein n=1 Tax=Desulfolucanica intricata TaxID=1285191 RepID=UPI000A817259|nr:hypothetical protein [Desulfolucanica intricata]